jgi:hypothetical protein
MVARSMSDLRQMLYRGLTEPHVDSDRRKQFIQKVFDCTLDGNAGKRVAEHLLELALRGRIST